MAILTLATLWPVQHCRAMLSLPYNQGRHGYHTHLRPHRVFLNCSLSSCKFSSKNLRRFQLFRYASALSSPSAQAGGVGVPVHRGRVIYALLVLAIMSTDLCWCCGGFLLPSERICCNVHSLVQEAMYWLLAQTLLPLCSSTMAFSDLISESKIRVLTDHIISLMWLGRCRGFFVVFYHVPRYVC